MQILNIRYDNITVDEALEKALALLEARSRAVILFLNADCVYKAKRDAEYESLIKKADLVLPDGVGLRIATSFAGGRMKENCNGTDFSPLLMSRTAEQGFRFFFMGSSDGVAQEAAEAVQKKYPKAVIAGTHSGFFKNNEAMIEKINSSGADILFVGMGVPLQEKWIFHHKDQLNVKMCVAVGALFDWLSGRLTRAPKVIRSLHIEWVWRILVDPRRLWRRYLVDCPQVLGWVLKDRFYSKASR